MWVRRIFLDTEKIPAHRFSVYTSKTRLTFLTHWNYDLFAQADDVDDITWNDLSMNEIFLRVNNCDTSVGEEVLYWRLRKCGMSEADRDAFERSAAARS